MEDNITFGLTEQDLKNQKIKRVSSTIKNILLMIGPTLIMRLNIIIYYILKFIRSIVGVSIRMIMGKEV